MNRESETGVVMGFNHHEKVKNGKSPDLVEQVEEAIEAGDQGTVERLVNRSRWDQELDDRRSTSQEKPLI